MKKLFYSLLAIGAVTGLLSCSADEPGVAKGDGNVSLTVQLPADAATRADDPKFGDAETINKLYYSICTTGQDAKVIDFDHQEWPKGQTSTTVDLQLVPGQTYQVVFFACDSTATGYTYTPDDASLEVKYGDSMINNDAYDAFYTVEQNISTATAEKGDPILLTRPFAQLNIGTNDLNKGVVTEYLTKGNYTTTLTIPGLATAVNFLSNTYTTPENNSVSFNLKELETVVESYPIPNYNYLEMNYLLVDPATADQSGATLVNATYTINAGDVEVNNLTLSSLPLRANYQTNVYGSLLTKKASFEVQIAPGFAPTTFDRIIIDGVSYKQASTPEIFTSSLESGDPVYVPAGTTLDLSDWSPATMDSFGFTINKPVNIRLDGNITNLSIPITFNKETNITGNGTISLSPNQKNYVNGYLSFGNDATIENVTIEGGNDDLNVAAIIYYNGLDETLTMNSVNVNSSISSLYGVEGIYVLDNCVFETNSDLQALMLESDFDATITNCTFISENIPLMLDNSKSAGNASGKAIIQGGACISTATNQPLSSCIWTAIVDVSIDGMYIYNNDQTGYSVLISPEGEHNISDNMKLSLTNVMTNSRIGEIEDMNTGVINSLGNEYFTYKDESSNLSILGNNYSFPWIVNGLYEKLKNN